MLKDELITKKNLKLKNEEFLQKCWYNGLKEDVFTEIKNCLFAECDYIVPTKLQGFVEEFDNHLYYCNSDCDCDCDYNWDECFKTFDSLELICYSEVFSFFRSKLWNEGINLLTTMDGKLWCAKIRKNEKYNDGHILPISSDGFMDLIIECDYTHDYYNVKRLYDEMTEKNQNVKKFDENILKNLTEPSLSNTATTVFNTTIIEPKKKKRKKGNKKKSNNNDKINVYEFKDSNFSDFKVNTLIKENNEGSTILYSNTDETLYKNNDINTYSNGKYDTITYAVNNHDVE